MRVFIDDLKKIGWLSEVIQKSNSKLFSATNDSHLVIYYQYSEYTSTIIVLAEDVRYIINEDIYRKLSSIKQAEFVGYLKAPFETNNYLFYAYLKDRITKCAVDGTITEEQSNQYRKNLNELFLLYKADDKERAKEKSVNSIKGVYPITSSLSLSEALDNIFYVNKKPLNGLSVMFSMLESYYKKNNISFYGDVLHSFVRLVKNPNGGVINQENGILRYLIIGEKVAGDDKELQEAKRQLRVGVDYNSIYLNTGWYYNKFDEKWRKNIPDGFVGFTDDVTFTNNYILSKSSTYNGGDTKLYEDLKRFNKNQISFTSLIMNGYKNKLADVVNFNAAYDKYPKLKEIYSVVVGGKNGEFNDSYYYSKAAPERIVLMRGQLEAQRLMYVVLHEIQHYVQKVEGFGNGGNLYLADLINSVGGGSTREFINTMGSFVKEVESKALDIDMAKLRNYLNLLIHRETPNQVKSLVLKCVELAQSNIILKEGHADFAYTLLNIYTFTFKNKAALTKLIEIFFDKKYITLFEDTLKQSKLVLEKNQNLVNKGWTPRDIYMLNFQTYQSLMGEAESRFVQNTKYVDENLRDYFALYSAETIEPQKITVLNESGISEPAKNIKAAIEQANGHYIIHLPREYSNSVNIIHEVGHILYDIMVDLEIVNPIDPTIEQEAKAEGYESSEEYICDSFVDYIHRKKIDEGLTEDLDEFHKITNYNTFDEYFESILLGNSMPVNFVGFKRRITFIENILKGI